jgi:hypothetical protein
VNLSQWLTAAGAALTLSAILGGASIVFRNRLKDELIETQEKRITALKEEMGENDQRCKNDISELRGQVNALSGTFAADLGRAIVQEVNANLRPVRRTARDQ